MWKQRHERKKSVRAIHYAAHILSAATQALLPCVARTLCLSCIAAQQASTRMNNECTGRLGPRLAAQRSGGGPGRRWGLKWHLKKRPVAQLLLLLNAVKLSS